MLIVQISDTHLPGPGSKTSGVAPMAEKLDACVKHLNGLSLKPDVVIVSGDVADVGTLEQYQEAKYYLDQLDCPYYVVPGNHDLRGPMLDAFCPSHCASMQGGFVNFIVDEYPVCLIGLDSTRQSHPGGEICQARAKWLDDQLAKKIKKPILIFMHHPPFNVSVSETNDDGFVGVELLADVIQKYQNIERIVCGHIHLVTHARWCGTTVSTAPSMGMQLELDLTMAKPSRFLLQDPAYQLHHWTEQKNLVTHTIFVSELPGPYSF